MIMACQPVRSRIVVLNYSTMPTLQELFVGQDMGIPHAANLCDQVLEDTFDANSDPISAIIINAFTKNESGYDTEGMKADIQYAISQLTKVLRTLS
jgi:hypothetical protein